MRFASPMLTFYGKVTTISCVCVQTKYRVKPNYFQIADGALECIYFLVNDRYRHLYQITLIKITQFKKKHISIHN